MNLSATQTTIASQNIFGKTMGYFGLALAGCAAGVWIGSYLLPPALVASTPFLLLASIATLVLAFTSRKWSVGKFGFGWLLLFAALIGVTMVPLLAYFALVNGIGIIFKALLATVAMFAGLAIYGMTTHRDLSGLVGFLFAGLIGMIAVSVITFVLSLFGVNVWNSTAEMIYSGFGILIFAGWTMYDFQRVSRRTVNPISAAVALFLDFINLFQLILRFMSASSR